MPVDFVHAVQRGDWHDVLRILREHQEHFPPADLAWLRGVSWAHLHHPIPAIRFFEEGASLRQLKPDEEIWLLTCMIQAKRAAEIVPRAQRIAETETEPLLLLKAAEALSVRASEVEDDEAAELRTAAIDTAERGLRLARKRPGDDLLAALSITTNLHLALDYEVLGRIDEALKCCDEALRLDPANANAMMLRAWLNRERNPEAAKGDFRRGFANMTTMSFDEMPLPSSAFALTAP
jgi:tetratricopeptide (TPR) repeat protein